MLNHEGINLQNVEVKTPSPISSFNDRSTNDEEEISENSSSGSSPLDLKKRLEDLPSQSEVTRLANRISAISRRLIRKRDIHYHLQGTTDRIEEKDEREERDQQEQVPNLDGINFKINDARARRRARIQLEILRSKEQETLLPDSDFISDSQAESHRRLPAGFQRRHAEDTEMWMDYTETPRCPEIGFGNARPTTYSLLHNLPNNVTECRFDHNELTPLSSLRTSRPTRFGGYRPVPGTFLRNLSSDSEESSNEIKPKNTAYLQNFNSPTGAAEPLAKFIEAENTVRTGSHAIRHAFSPRLNFSHENSSYRAEDSTGSNRFDDVNRRTKDSTPKEDVARETAESHISNTSFQRSINDPRVPSVKKDSHGRKIILTPLSSSRTIPQETFTRDLNYQLEISEDSHNNNAMTNLSVCDNILPLQTRHCPQLSEDEEHTNLCSIRYLFNETGHLSLSNATARSRSSSKSANNSSDCVLTKTSHLRAQTSCESSPLIERCDRKDCEVSTNRSLLQFREKGIVNNDRHSSTSTPKQNISEEAKEQFKQNTALEEQTVLNTDELFTEYKDQSNSDTYEERVAVDVPALDLNSQEISYSTSPGSKTFSGKRLDANALFAALSTVSASSKLEDVTNAPRSNRNQLLNNSQRIGTLRSSETNSTAGGSSQTPESFQSKITQDGIKVSEIPRRRYSKIPVKINSNTYRASPKAKNEVDSVRSKVSSCVGTTDSEMVSDRTEGFFVREATRDQFSMGINDYYSHRNERQSCKVNQAGNQDIMVSLNQRRRNYGVNEEIGDAKHVEIGECNKTQTTDELPLEINRKSQLEGSSVNTASVTEENIEKEAGKRQDKLRYSAEKLAAEELRKYVGTKQTRAILSENDSLLIPLHRIQPSSSTSRLHYAADKAKAVQYCNKKSQDRFPFTISEKNSAMSPILRDRGQCTSLERDSKYSGNIYKLSLHPSITRLAGAGTEETPSEIINYVARTELQKTHDRLSAVKGFIRRFSAKFKKSSRQCNGESAEETNVIYKNHSYQTESEGNTCSESSLIEGFRYKTLPKQQRSNRNSPDKESSAVFNDTIMKTLDSEVTAICAEHPHRQHKRDNLWVQEISEKHDSPFFIKPMEPLKKATGNTQNKERFPKGKRKRVVPRSNSLPLISTTSNTDAYKITDKDNTGYKKLQNSNKNAVARSESESRTGCICCRICRKLPHPFIAKTKHSSVMRQRNTGHRVKRRARFLWKKKG